MDHNFPFSEENKTLPDPVTGQGRSYWLLVVQFLPLASTRIRLARTAGRRGNNHVFRFCFSVV